MGRWLRYPLVLASASPRRQQLLQEAGYEFEVVAPPVSEPPAPARAVLRPAAWAEALAYFKARSVAGLRPQALILAADTLCLHGQTIIGKPRDLAEARRILSEQFGGRNEVITGLALLLPARGERLLTHVVTTLIMRPMSPAELEAYLASGAWQGKAGAYALQEGGDRFVQAMAGSASNVVGLPLEKVEELLGRFGGEQGREVERDA